MPSNLSLDIYYIFRVNLFRIINISIHKFSILKFKPKDNINLILITAMTVLTLTTTLDNSKIIGRIGGRKVDKVSTPILKKIKVLKEKFTERIMPRLTYDIFEIASVQASSVQIADGITFNSEKLSKTVKFCDEMVVFVATIGDGLEKEVGRLMDQNRYSMAYILDAIGSVAAEGAVEKFYRMQAEAYKKQDKRITLRFSPGYCDWSVTEQKKLFKLMHSNKINVKLLDSYLMHPRKSVSGVFGITSAQNASAYSYNPCRTCDKKKCDGRR